MWERVGKTEDGGDGGRGTTTEGRERERREEEESSRKGLLAGLSVGLCRFPHWSQAQLEGLRRMLPPARYATCYVDSIHLSLIALQAFIVCFLVRQVFVSQDWVIYALRPASCHDIPSPTSYCLLPIPYSVLFHAHTSLSLPLP